MRANVANQPVYCQMRLTAGGDFTGTATVEVSIDGGSFTSGAGTVSYPGSGSHKYIPTQAETNGTLIVFRFSGSGAFTRLKQFNTWFDANMRYYLANSLPATPIAGYPVTLGPFVTNGTCQSGSTSTTIVLASGASATNDFYKGLRVWIPSGTGAGQWAMITGYVGSTKVATIDGTWRTTPDNTSTYIVDYGFSLPSSDYAAANWTANEKTAMRAILGIPAAGTTPDDPTTGVMATIRNRVGAWTGTGVNTLLGAFKALFRKDASAPSDIGGTFDPTTDSVESLQEQLTDVAEVTEMLATMIEEDDEEGVYRFTAPALANSPAGTPTEFEIAINRSPAGTVIVSANLRRNAQDVEITDGSMTVVCYEASSGVTAWTEVSETVLQNCYFNVSHALVDPAAGSIYRFKITIVDDDEIPWTCTAGLPVV